MTEDERIAEVAGLIRTRLMQILDRSHPASLEGLASWMRSQTDHVIDVTCEDGVMTANILLPMPPGLITLDTVAFIDAGSWGQEPRKPRTPRRRWLL